MLSPILALGPLNRRTVSVLKGVRPLQDHCLAPAQGRGRGQGRKSPVFTIYSSPVSWESSIKRDQNCHSQIRSFAPAPVVWNTADSSLPETIPNKKPRFKMLTNPLLVLHTHLLCSEELSNPCRGSSMAMEKKCFRTVGDVSFILLRVPQCHFPLCVPRKVWDSSISVPFPSQLNFQGLLLHLQNDRLFLESFNFFFFS